jgi:hypothetical protein
MKLIILLSLALLFSITAFAQVSSPHHNIISGGGVSGTNHPSTNVPTHYSVIGQPMVMPFFTPGKSASGVLTAANLMFDGVKITGFSPGSGVRGTVVTISGSNFKTTASENEVKFNGVAAVVTASTSVSITTTVPENATTGKITVTVGDKTATSEEDFIVVPPPTITGFDPDSGPIGTSVIITGTNFSEVPETNEVRFNGVLAEVTSSTSTSITTKVPALATTGPISVKLGDELVTSAAAFTVIPPTITGFDPITGAEGMTVIISGTDFSETPEDNDVKFNGVAAVVTASTSTSITTTVPVSASTGPITVNVGGQLATSENDFVVIPPPSITSFSPTSGEIGQTVIITGVSFSEVAENNVVKFNEVLATVTESSSTSITTTVPATATTGLISVEIAGLEATSADVFTVIPPGVPNISGFTPENGAVGTTVEITGSSFSTIASNNQVKFNGIDAEVTASTSNSITTTVPLMATSGKITVTLVDQTAESATDFIVNGPAISSFSPTSGPVGTTVTLTGTNFSTTPEINIVRFNGLLTAVTASTSTSITTTVPVGAASGLITLRVGAINTTSSSNFTVTLCSNPPKPTISASGINTEAPVLTSSSSTGNQWYLNNAAISGATNNTLTASQPGIYKVRVSVAGGCVSEFSDDYALIVTGDSGHQATDLLKVYPNPADDRLFIETSMPGIKTLLLVDGFGRTITQYEFEGSGTEVNVSDYRTGVYYYMLSGSGGAVTGKFVKK